MGSAFGIAVVGVDVALVVTAAATAAGAAVVAIVLAFEESPLLLQFLIKLGWSSSDDEL